MSDRATFVSYALWRWLPPDRENWAGRRLSALWHTLDDAWYYAKCALWTRWNVLRIDSLGPTYADPDDVMFHAAFQCLVNAVEKEELYAGWNLDDIGSHLSGGDWEREQLRCQLEAYREIRGLYLWWTMDRPARGEYQLEHDDEDQAQFMKLAALRRWLWT